MSTALRLMVTGLLLVAGCAQKVNGPTPTVTSVEPPVVCNALDNEMTIHGEDFAPLGKKVLEDGRFIELPAISMTDPGAQLVSIDPAETAWSDEATMTFWLRAAQSYTPGTYTVSVTNPNGNASKTSATFEVVPPPTITSLNPSSVYNGVNTTVTITGTGFRMTPTVTIEQPPAAAINLTPVTYVSATEVSVVVPQGTPPGTYTLTLTNPEGCAATATLRVTDVMSVAVNKIVNPFGWVNENTPVTISGGGFVSTPTAYLIGAAAAGGDLKLRNVAFVSGSTLTGTVPGAATTPPGKIGGPYDLRVINPDGSMGSLPAAFTITKLAPPSIDNVNPTSFPNNYDTAAAGSGPLVVTGQNFRADATVVLVDDAGNEIALPGLAVTVDSATQLTVNFNAGLGTLSTGVYLLRVKEADDAVASGGTGAMMYADYSLIVITQPSQKFQAAVDSTDLPAGRKGHGVAGGQVNQAARFLYVVGGDGGGEPATTFADGLYAKLDIFGRLGAAGWVRMRKHDPASNPSDLFNDLPTGRTGLGLKQHAGWVYAVGGSEDLATARAPGAPLQDVVRARILPADEAPTVTSTVVATGGSLPEGTYYYRVATLLDTGTPGYGAGAAETVGSDEEIVAISAGQSPKLSFVDAASLPSGKIIGHRIYRSPTANASSQSEVWIADVAGGVTDFTDTGSATPGTAHPLEEGMLSAWESASSLQVKRAYAAVTIAKDPSADTYYLYAIGGKSDSGGTREQTYEYATINGDGSLGAWGPGSLSSNNCAVENCMIEVRWSAWTSVVSGPPAVSSSTWIVVGGGALASNDTDQERAEVQAGGALAAWAAVPIQGGGAFTADPRSEGVIGFYKSGHIGWINGFNPGNGTVSNKDEFGNEACTSALVSGACPVGTDFKQTSKSDSGFNQSPPTAWSGYALTSGYLFVVGGSTDGVNAVATVKQGAQ